MRDTVIARLSEIADKDKRVMLLTGDLGFKVLDEFAKRFPRQFLNVGVAEQNMTGIATGLALDGRIVFTYSIANFPTLRTLEQIRNGPCYHDLNVNILAIGGGFSYGQLGFSHHATEDLAVMRAMPNVTVIAPCDKWEAAEATEALVNKSGVGYLRVDKSDVSGMSNGTKFAIGKARRIREGTNLTIIGCGGILAEALEAAETLKAEHSLDCRVISMHSLTQIDLDELRLAVSETKAIFTIEEHTVVGGLGSAIAENLAENGLNPRVFYRFGMRSGLCSVVGDQRYLRKECGIDSTSIARQITEILGEA